MKNFKYTIKDSAGLRHEGTRKAVCEQDVLMWIRDNNQIPISVEEIVGKGKGGRRKGARIRSAEIGNFCWQLATMMEGGISITESLETIADDMDNVRFSKVVLLISEGILRGETFSDGLADYPNVFDKLFYGMVLAGESSGAMPMVLRQLADYYDNRDKIIKMVKGALIYPAVVVGFVFVIITIMSVYIIPMFRSIFDTIAGDMPAFTEAFLAVNDVINASLMYIIPGLVVLFVALSWYRKTPKGHENVSRFTLSMPMFGRIILLAFVAIFCRTSSALLGAGVSVMEMLDILATMSKNEIIKQAILKAKDGITSGGGISTSLASSKLFPNLVIKMVYVGEQTGALPDVLSKTADYYERKVEDTISTMTKLLEPILIIVVGAIVLVVVVALYLPIFYMSDI